MGKASQGEQNFKVEIERKFLVNGEGWRELALGVKYCQGYLNSQKERSVRVRTIGEQAFLTIKGLTRGITRSEFEYEIPLDDALFMLNELCEKPLIEKFRYQIEYQGLLWEVDEFLGENQGLIFAEVELEKEDQEITLPPWIGEEVSGDIRYFNSNLIHHPFSKWK